MASSTAGSSVTCTGLPGFVRAADQITRRGVRRQIPSGFAQEVDYLRCGLPGERVARPLFARA
jgi:hypothetical protein